MIRSLVAVLMIAFAAVSASAQLSGVTMQPGRVVAASSETEFPSKSELLRRIGLYENAARQAEAARVDRVSLVKIYANLGSLYEDAAMYSQSEAAMRRAVALLEAGPPEALAEELGHLGVLHAAMGEVREAENDALRALRVREAAGDPVGIALARSDLADLYINLRQYKKALDYAQRAVDVLGDRPDVSAADRIASRQTLAAALCGRGECAKAIPLLQDTIELDKRSFGEDSLAVGIGEYLLGFAYWKNGDEPRAAEWMARGIARMKVDLGWGHTIYVKAMKQYAQFLRVSGSAEAAATAEREIRQMEMVVDARALVTKPAELRPAGLQ